MKTKKIVLLQMLVLVTLLTGCTAVLFNNSGTSQPSGRSSSVRSEDRSITATVKAALIRDAQVNAFNITVRTYKGVVTLQGYAQNQTQRTRAINTSQSISRVKYVVSQLNIKE